MADSELRKTFARLFYRLGFTANALTVLGLGLAGFSGWLCYQGKFFEAAAVLLASGLLDMMDGAVARLSGTAGKFGGIFDSTLDRYGDACIFGGLLFFCARTGRESYAILAFAALAGSFVISYVRARAECEIDSCRVGFWERGERIGLLTIGLAAKNPASVLWILALVTQWTVFERVWEARRQTRFADGAPVMQKGIRTAERRSILYAVKVVFWAGLACLWRPPF